MNNIRIGNGFDVHQFVEERELILGGTTIPHPFGLMGHSDADVLIHALIDSIAGVSGFGDIGKLFPDTDPAYKNISSILLLQKIAQKLKEKKITIINSDSIIVCEQPKIAPFIHTMRENIANALDVTAELITIKGKTTEKLGFTGRKEGIAAYTVTLLQLPEQK